MNKLLFSRLYNILQLFCIIINGCQIRKSIASFSWREVDAILLKMTFAEFGPKVSERATYVMSS